MWSWHEQAGHNIYLKMTFFVFYIQPGQISVKKIFSNEYFSCFEWKYCAVSQNGIYMSGIYLHFSNCKFLIFCEMDCFRFQKPLAIGPVWIPRYQDFWDKIWGLFLEFQYNVWRWSHPFFSIKVRKKCVSYVTCHLSPVTCHMTYVTCHLSPVTWHVSPDNHFMQLQLLWKSIEVWWCSYRRPQLNECSRQCSCLVLARCSMGFGPNPLINGLILHTFKLNILFLEKFTVIHFD